MGCEENGRRAAVSWPQVVSATRMKKRSTRKARTPPSPRGCDFGARGGGISRGSGATLKALLLLASARKGRPVNPRVTYGNAAFQKVGGNNWVITTSGKAIISYSSSISPGASG